MKKLLQLATDLTPEQVEVSIRVLKDSSSTVIITPTYNIDCSILDYIKLTISDDIVLGFSGAVVDGQQITVAIRQLVQAPNSVTFDSSVRFGMDFASFPGVSPVVDRLDRFIFMFDSDSNKYDFIGYARGY